MKRPLCGTGLFVAGLLCLACLSRFAPIAHAFPEPSSYPISWQLNFEHSAPHRMVLRPKGSGSAEAYWYVTYTVTNLTKDEQHFLPVFELMTEDGQVIRSDVKIPQDVVDAVRSRERNPRLATVTDLTGVLRVGEDQARDGVAIWKEPSPEMGRFSIFVGGLSGEAVILKDASGKEIQQASKDGAKEPVVLHKTLQIQYLMVGDEKFPGNDPVELVEERWVMR